MDQYTKRVLSLVFSLAILLTSLLAGIPAAAAAAGHVVINQIYGGGGKGKTPFDYSFIELYNPTDQGVPLSGWKLIYASNRGDNEPGATDGEAVFSLDSGNGNDAVPPVIGAGESFLIRGAQEKTEKVKYSLADAARYDASWAERYIDNKATFYVVLADKNDNTVDAFSNQKGAEKEGPVASDKISKQKSYRRERFADTDNNAADFKLLTWESADEAFIKSYYPRSSADGKWQEQTATPGTPATPSMPVPGKSLKGKLAYIGNYATGKTSEDGGVAEIVKYSPANKKIYLVNGTTAQIDIVDVSGLKHGIVTELKKPGEIAVDELVANAVNGFTYGDVTSVDVFGDTVAIAVQAKDYTAQGLIVLLDLNGQYLASYPCGVQPDALTFTPDGKYILTADEGEPREGYEEGAVDPKGSVTILNLETRTVKTVTFDGFDRDSLLKDKVILKKGSEAATDLEPEFVTVSSDSKTAWVSLQEANAIATLDIEDARFTAVKGLGFKDHSKTGNELDAERNQKVELKTYENVYGVYMPDGIAAAEIDGKTYLLTANEGDAREWSAKNSTYVDITQKVLGESKIDAHDASTKDGLEEGNTYLLGARSFSIWDASDMSQRYDSGSDFERIIAENYPSVFNADHNAKDIFDRRSNKKGPEPEYVATLRVENNLYAFTGLERFGGVMMYDITSPSSAKFADFISARNFAATTLKESVASGPEGLCAVKAQDSPTGYPLIFVANEVSGSVSVFEVQEGYVAPADGNNQGDGVVTIFHTNDMHGVMDGKMSIATVAAYKDSVPGALLVDGGDATQGNSFATLTKGADVITLMNMAGYDAMAVGNHEFDYGLDGLTRNARHADFPILSANSVKDGAPVLSNLSYADSAINNGAWHLEKTNGVTVGFFGITTPETTTKANPDGIRGITFGQTVQDVAASAREQIKALNDAGADVIVGLMHLGIDTSSTVQSTLIAEALSGTDLDVIIDAHSHSVYDKTVAGIRIVQAGGGGANLGKVVITTGEGGKVQKVDSTLIKGANATVAPDAEIKATYDALKAEQEKQLAPKIGHTSVTFWGGTVEGINEARLYETNLGSLIADSMADAARSAVLGTKYEQHPIVALENGGGVRTVIKAGDITRGSVLNVLPFGNILAYTEITPNVLYAALENGVAKLTGQDPETGRISGPAGGFPQVSGMRFEYNPNAPVGSRIGKVVLLNADGSDASLLSRADDQTVLVLVSNDFELAGGDGYTMLGELPVIGEGGALDEILAAYVTRLTAQMNGSITYPITQGRVTTFGDYTPKPYTARVAVKDGNGNAALNATVSYQVDGVAHTGTTDAQGWLIIEHLSDGPHAIRLPETGDVLVNNYSGAGFVASEKAPGPNPTPDPAPAPDPAPDPKPAHSTSHGSHSSDAKVGTAAPPANAPAALTAARADAAVAAALRGATVTSGGTVTLSFRNIGTVSKKVFDSILKAAAGKPVTAMFDTMTRTGSVDVRLYIDPVAVTGDLNVFATTTGAEASAAKTIFTRHFSNGLSVVHFGQADGFGAPVRAAVKVGIADTENLVLYAYDKRTNTFSQIPAAQAWMDANGYLHFTTALSGDIIISQGALTPKK